MGKIVGLTFAEEAPTEKLACPHCAKEYKSAEALADHIKKKHPAPGLGTPAPGEGDPQD
ncbi:MAG: C2H2-type zinc finger protein [Oscillospiraceae bacterium]